jgi:hypothetical protein
MMVFVEQLVEWGLAGENLSQCHFVHHKSRMIRTGLKPGSLNAKPATNRLSYGKAFFAINTSE